MTASSSHSRPGLIHHGGTALIDPYGGEISVAKDGQEGFACGDIDLAHLVSYHRKFPVLEDADRFELL